MPDFPSVYVLSINGCQTVKAASSFDCLLINALPRCCRHSVSCYIEAFSAESYTKAEADPPDGDTEYGWEHDARSGFIFRIPLVYTSR